MTLYRESYVVRALADRGFVEMTENEAIAIWIEYGIRPSLSPIGLDEAMKRAKARMLRPAKTIHITENEVRV